jgi:hypothetical protein
MMSDLKPTLENYLESDQCWLIRGAGRASEPNPFARIETIVTASGRLTFKFKSWAKFGSYMQQSGCSPSIKDTAELG